MVGMDGCSCIFAAVNPLDGIPADWSALQQLYNCESKFPCVAKLLNQKGLLTKGLEGRNWKGDREERLHKLLGCDQHFDHFRNLSEGRRESCVVRDG